MFVAVDSPAMAQAPPPRSQSPVPAALAGYTLADLLAALGVLGILLATAVPHLDFRRMYLTAGHRLVIAQLRLARTDAITKSKHVVVDFPARSSMRIAPMKLVDGTWVVDDAPRRTLALPEGIQVAEAVVGTSIEFNSRGEATSLRERARINMSDGFGATKSVEVWPSGQVDEP